ncbi:MAG TPA: tetrahydromethanopterin S-methyltransferase subunit C [Methanothermococcus okinawensis]|uniref:Tetrahydromethanopterin S-methyltransferase subunit C n=1 Tax=Methanothermococcus okinawensis TaxID=155863 RepID=A0A832ZYW4_9EURY|nr:tetrahydromethanopterin S-methyltransferase subunit C [Methanothermococcus okinawensis]
MSHGGGGHAAELYPENQIVAVGTLLAILGMYIAQFFPQVSMLLGGLLASAATVAGANTTRKVAAYGLGTGVPSIGMLSLGMGIISSVSGIYLVNALVKYFKVDSLVLYAIPIVVTVIALILGYIVGRLTVKPIGMKIPVMVESMTKLSLMGALSILGFCAAYAGGFLPDIIIPGSIKNGVMALAFIAAGMAILHPFNACLGPDESHRRTLTLAVACGFLTWFVFSVAKLDVISTVVSLVLWALVYREFIKQSLRDACAVYYTPELPKREM